MCCRQDLNPNKANIQWINQCSSTAVDEFEICLIQNLLNRFKQFLKMTDGKTVSGLKSLKQMDICWDTGNVMCSGTDSCTQTLGHSCNFKLKRNNTLCHIYFLVDLP